MIDMRKQSPELVDGSPKAGMLSREYGVGSTEPGVRSREYGAESL